MKPLESEEGPMRSTKVTSLCTIVMLWGSPGKALHQLAEEQRSTSSTAPWRNLLTGASQSGGRKFLTSKEGDALQLERDSIEGSIAQSSRPQG
jgi:hypothetical protein